MGVLWSDIVFAVRSLRRRPAFVGAVVATLALGIGANAALFSLVDAIILRPVAVGNRDGLVAISQPKPGAVVPGNTFATYLNLASRATSLSDVAAYVASSVSLGDGDSTQQVSVHFVTHTYFSLLGVGAGVGRVISPTDAADDMADPVVVLSAAFWRDRFGGDRAVIGRRIHVGNQLLTVIGVAPEGFHGTDLSAIPDIWVPLSVTPTMSLGLLSLPGTLSPSSKTPLFRIIGRLASGMTAVRAAAELNLIAGAGTTPIVVRSLRESAAGRDPAELLRFIRLMGAVVMLTLLLACLNVANLLTIRAKERAKELGIRTALGASASRVMRQLLTESFLLALGGGVIGLAVAVVMLRLLAAYTLPGAISVDRLSLALEPRVLAFTFIVAALTAIGFGVFPAARASRVSVVDALKQHAATGGALGRRGALLASQIAISLMLVVGAGLFLRSVQAGFATDVGFDARGIAVVGIPYQFEGHWRDHAAQYFAMVQQASRSAGVTAVAAGSSLPLSGSLTGTMSMPFGPGPASPSSLPNDDKLLNLHLSSVTDQYFKVLGTPILFGRGFGPQDVEGAPRVIVLNEAAARALWPGESAIGKQVHFRSYVTYTVVGIAKNIKYGGLIEPDVPLVGYAPMTQEEPTGVVLLARGDHPRDLLGVLKNAITSVAPSLKPQRPRLLADQISTLLMPQRFGATLLSLFAILALCVSAVGIYGTVAYAVAKRTTEIGIRMALGAQRGDVLRLVLSESSVAIAVGVALGLVGAALTTRLLTHLLYEVSASDWVSFGGAIVVMCMMAILASLVPAGRAVRVDPLEAMRTSE